MKVTLHLEGNRQEVLNQIDEFRTVLTTSLDAQPPKGGKPKAAPEPEAPLVSEADKLKGKKGAKGKKPEPEPDTGEDDTDQEEDGENSSDESADDMGFTEEEEEAEEEEAPKQSDVINACRAFTKGNDAKKAVVKKLLASFKVKSVLDLKAAQYKDFLAKLKKS
jgi:hypothetical protein